MLKSGEKAIHAIWSDEVNDPTVDQLLDDIIFGCIREDGWKTDVKGKGKRSLAVRETGKPNKKIKPLESGDKAKKKLKKKVEIVEDDDFVDFDMGSRQPSKQLKKKKKDSEEDDDFLEEKRPEKRKKKMKKNLEREEAEDSGEHSGEDMVFEKPIKKKKALESTEAKKKESSESDEPKKVSNS